jgi:hypothetical protein
MRIAIDPTKPKDGMPAVKADLRANLLALKRGIETLQATKLGRGHPLDMRGHQVIRAQLIDVCGPSPMVKVSAGTVTLDLEAGNLFEVILTESVASVVFANPPPAGRAGVWYLILKQDDRGGRALDWPSSIRWPKGSPPHISAAKNAVDFFAFVTRDGGITWYGFVDGYDFR